MEIGAGGGMVEAEVFGGYISGHSGHDEAESRNKRTVLCTYTHTHTHIIDLMYS